MYEPGSVMKVVTLAGAIDAGKIKPSTVIDDPGALYIGGYRIADWDGANHGKINYTYVLEHSLNVGAMKAMLAEGHASFYKYLQSLRSDPAERGRRRGRELRAAAAAPARWPTRSTRPPRSARASTSTWCRCWRRST